MTADDGEERSRDLAAVRQAVGREARALLEVCRARGMMLATAESCTGGLIMGALTDVPGSSAVVERGFITYSNAAKTALVGVPPDLLEAHGAVSEPVARAMAAGALAAAPVGIALAVTGVAGPGGGTAAKPEGLVHFAAATSAGASHVEQRFGPIGRDMVRWRSVLRALQLGLERLRA